LPALKISRSRALSNSAPRKLTATSTSFTAASSSLRSFPASLAPAERLRPAALSLPLRGAHHPLQPSETGVVIVRVFQARTDWLRLFEGG
jgi:hypothetical protein